MEELIAKVMEYLPSVLQALGALVVLASAVVRIPGVGGDKQVDSAASGFFKVMGYLPTLGINPRTKKLEEALKGMKK